MLAAGAREWTQVAAVRMPLLATWGRSGTILRACGPTALGPHGAAFAFRIRLPGALA